MRIAGSISRKIRESSTPCSAHFASGAYFANTSAQAEVFGGTPAVDDPFRRYLEQKRLAS